MKQKTLIVYLIIVSFFPLFAEKKNKELVLHFSDTMPMLHPQVSFDASNSQIMTALYEGLFIYDPYTCQPMTGLVDTWKVEGNRWKFKIKKTAKFQNGELITAQTIKDSWLNLLDPEAQYPYASLFDCIKGAEKYRLGISKNKNEVDITAENDFTLCVNLKSPMQHFSKILCHHAFAPVHSSQRCIGKHYMKTSYIKDVENAFIPISNGPFIVKSYTANEIKLVKNQHYWDKKNVALDSITIKMRMSPNEQTEAFNRGEINWIKSYANLENVVGHKTIHYTPLFSTEYLFLNVINKPLDNQKFRMALLLAVPYKDLRKDHPIPATTLVFPIAGYEKVKGIEEFNIDKAKKIIKELNLSDEEKIIKIQFPNNKYYKEVAHTLKQSWENIGLVVETKFLNFSDYYVSFKKNDYTVGAMTWIGDFADPMAFLELFRMNSTLNNSNWHDKKFDNLIQKSNIEYNPSTRHTLLAKAEQLLLDSNIIIPISHNFAINVINMSEISGWYSNPLDIHPFKFIDFIQMQTLPGIVKK